MHANVFYNEKNNGCQSYKEQLILMYQQGLKATDLKTTWIVLLFIGLYFTINSAKAQAYKIKSFE